MFKIIKKECSISLKSVQKLETKHFKNLLTTKNSPIKTKFTERNNIKRDAYYTYITLVVAD